MTSTSSRLVRDVGIRLAGLSLLAIGYFLLRYLFHSHSQSGDPPLLEYAVAAAAIPCGSVGATLAALGRGILDPVPISARWAPQTTPGVDAPDPLFGNETGQPTRAPVRLSAQPY